MLSHIMHGFSESPQFCAFWVYLESAILRYRLFISLVIQVFFRLLYICLFLIEYSFHEIREKNRRQTIVVSTPGFDGKSGSSFLDLLHEMLRLEYMLFTEINYGQKPDPSLPFLLQQI